jgi:hypothetical protein
MNEPDPSDQLAENNIDPESFPIPPTEESISED